MLLAFATHHPANAQAARAAASSREPPTPTAGYAVSGLDKPVEILVDQWGVPHIYAKSAYDAFFAQGFNAARDRLWQIDLWRRKGLGLLAEVFGPSAVARDEAARLFLYRGDLYRERLAYGSDTKRILEAFVGGINAYVQLVADNPDLLPVEFRLLDYKPARWSADDLLRIRAHGAWGNLKSEVRRAQIGCLAGLKADLARRSLEPDQPPKIPDGSDLCDVREEALTQYRLATSDVAFTRPVATVTPTSPSSPPSPSATAQPVPVMIVPVEPADTGGDSELGSAFAIAGRATQGGKPLLAIDLAERRTHALPPARYLAHLSAPGFNVIGAGDPFLPGLVAGHNDRVAWGPVRYPIDQEDLVVADLNAAGDAIRIGNQSEPVEMVNETISVRGGSSANVTLRFTRNGPIVSVDNAKAKAWIVRAGWLDVGMAPALSSIGLARAQGWDAFLAAMNRWGGAPAAQLYADVDGAIGWKAGGLAPVRRGYDGLLPAPVDGRYAWTGFTDNDQLPVELNPPRGSIVLAGQPPSVFAVSSEGAAATTNAAGSSTATALLTRTPLPGARAAAVATDSSSGPWPLPREWSPRWRAERIAELLDRSDKKTAQDLFAIQSDMLSIPARRLVLLLKDTVTQDLKVSEAISLLRNWDFRVTAESPAAALFQVWYDRHLAPAMIALRSKQGMAKLIDVADSESLIALLEQPAAKLQRDTVFIGTLRQAVADMEQRQGTNWLRWNWGSLHGIEFAHPLSRWLRPASAMPLPAPIVRPRGGSAFTVAAAPYRAQTLQASGGASLRMVFDLANWDNALASNAPGQSGDPRSRHYGDLVDSWSKDAPHPLLYSRGLVEKATVLKIFLNPVP